MLAKEWRSLSFEEQMSYHDKVITERLGENRRKWEWAQGVIERDLKKKPWHRRFFNVILDLVQYLKRSL